MSSIPVRTVALDEGVEKLAAFNATLATTVTELQQAAEALTGNTDGLDRVEHESGEQLGALNQDLHKHHSTIAQMHEQAERAVEDAAAFAAKTTDGRLEPLEDKAHALAGELERDLGANADALEESAQELVSSGFEPAAAVAEALRQEAEREKGELAGACEDLEEAAGDAREGIEAVGEEVHESVEEFESDLKRHAGTLAKASELADYLGEDYMPDLSAAAEGVAESLDELYGEWARDGEGAAGEMGTKLLGLLEEVGEFLTTDADESLTEAVGDAEGSQELEKALTVTQGALNVGRETAESAAALVPQLVRSDACVDEVDRLLQALDD